ncbi:ketol-acid reductoisomerase [Methanosarcinales archaeon]|nr:MAG: ketol-acid reductoisomerase [Methanosarcinales archaeon]
MAKVYHDEDIDTKILEDRTIAIIGYGNQGEAQAKNLRDSGISVVVGVREDGNSWKKANADGFRVLPISKAAEEGDIIHMLVPDEVQSKVYDKYVAPHMSYGNALSFSHGFNIYFRWIKPPENVDVLMVAPKGPGFMVRKLYEEGFGVPALVAVEQDFTGNALEIALAMAKAMGLSRAGVIKTTFYEETTSDLFGEQVVLCGGVTALIESAYKTLVDAGYQPEIAYFECLHELKLIVDLIQQGGMEYMWKNVSNTAEYGGRTRGNRVISAQVVEEMKKILEEVQSGKFAEEWRSESEHGMPFLKKAREDGKKKDIEIVGERIRAMFKL